MKNLLLAIALCVGFFSNAQKMSMSFLEGTWIPQSFCSELTFSGTSSSSFRIEMIAPNEERTPLKILGYQFDKNNFYLESVYERNDFQCIGKFTILDKNTISVDYVSDAPAVVIYKRKQ